MSYNSSFAVSVSVVSDAQCYNKRKEEGTVHDHEIKLLPDLLPFMLLFIVRYVIMFTFITCHYIIRNFMLNIISVTLSKLSLSSDECLSQVLSEIFPGIDGSTDGETGKSSEQDVECGTPVLTEHILPLLEEFRAKHRYDCRHPPEKLGMEAV